MTIRVVSVLGGTRFLVRRIVRHLRKRDFFCSCLPQGIRNVVKNYSVQMTLTFTQSGRMFVMNNQSPMPLLALSLAREEPAFVREHAHGPRGMDICHPRSCLAPQRRPPVALFGARRCSLAHRPGEVLRGPSDRREGKLDCLSVQTDRALVRSRARDRGTAGRRGDATQASVNQDLGGGSTGFHVGLTGNSRRRHL